MHPIPPPVGMVRDPSCPRRNGYAKPRSATAIYADAVSAD